MEYDSYFNWLASVHLGIGYIVLRGVGVSDISEKNILLSSGYIRVSFFNSFSMFPFCGSSSILFAHFLLCRIFVL